METSTKDNVLFDDDTALLFSRVCSATNSYSYICIVLDNIYVNIITYAKYNVLGSQFFPPLLIKRYRDLFV